jgi:hypothetical protein
MDNAIERMRRDISFDRIGTSNEFRVSFQYGDAKQARRIEKELIDKLMAASVVMRVAEIIGTNPYYVIAGTASLPNRPSSPNRFLIAAMGFAGGLLLGTLTALVARTRASTAPAGNSPKSS